jgi:hypothetical protein
MSLTKLMPIGVMLLCATMAAAQDRGISALHVFPVIVDGRQADGTSYRTSVVLQNSSQFSITCFIGFQGVIPEMTAPDGTVVRSALIQQLLPAGSFDVLRSSGTGPLGTGYSWVTCSLPITAYTVISSYSADGGSGPRLNSEATVNSSASATTFQFINDQREDGQLALSFANDQTMTTSVSVQVFDINGRMLAISRLLVPAKTSTARFLSELIPGLPAKHIGPVRVDSTFGIYATGLRFTGSVLTAIPPALSGFIY